MQHRAASVSELWDGEMQARSVGGKRVLLVHWEGRIHAYEDRCAHLGVPLSEGMLDKGVITCSAHHYQYDACTGAGINPRSVCLRRYPVRIDGNDIYVDLGEGVR